jgi:CRISPR-associated protein Cas1
MTMIDLHELPKMRDSLSYLYVERAIVERKDSAVEFINEDGHVHVPAANLSVLLLGPGTKITHAAVKILADCGCSIVWTGTDMNRFYAQGMGETRKAYHLLRQAELASIPEKRTEVVLRMYRKRFQDQLDPSLSLPQIRGFEGVRMRDAYAEAAKMHGVKWEGRRYDRNNWDVSDPINRALSAANALLNSLCHAAIVSGGYSTAIGFIHTGKQLSFVYDIADLYKTEISIPAAFEMTAKYPGKPEPYVRAACRERFREAKLLARILPDIDDLLQVGEAPELAQSFETDPALPADLWNALLDEEMEA